MAPLGDSCVRHLKENPVRRRAWTSVLAACMLLEHIGDRERAARIRAALESTIREGTTVTRDLGGSASTDQFTDAVIAKL